ncbi:hypothetical protein [Nonomuraea dietziae]|uniref:hypothetical protein n=1 Tax=Nonomuraea dietziae TaxID=65515 RepID=UPI0034036DF6
MTIFPHARHGDPWIPTVPEFMEVLPDGTFLKPVTTPVAFVTHTSSPAFAWMI